MRGDWAELPSLIPITFPGVFKVGPIPVTICSISIDVIWRKYYRSSKPLLYLPFDRLCYSQTHITKYQYFFIKSRSAELVIWIMCDQIPLVDGIFRAVLVVEHRPPGDSHVFHIGEELLILNIIFLPCCQLL